AKRIWLFPGDLAVVEDHFRQLVQGAPGTFRVEMSRCGSRGGVVDQGIIAYADKALHDPAVCGKVDTERVEDLFALFSAGPAVVTEGAALFEIDGFQSCPFAENALRGAIEVFFFADVAAGER